MLYHCYFNRKTFLTRGYFCEFGFCCSEEVYRIKFPNEMHFSSRALFGICFFFFFVISDVWPKFNALNNLVWSFFVFIKFSFLSFNNFENNCRFDDFIRDSLWKPKKKLELFLTQKCCAVCCFSMTSEFSFFALFVRV